MQPHSKELQDQQHLVLCPTNIHPHDKDIGFLGHVRLRWPPEACELCHVHSQSNLYLSLSNQH